MKLAGTLALLLVGCEAAAPPRPVAEVAEVLERTRERIAKWLRRRGLLLEDDDASDESAPDGTAALAASAASGQAPPAGPEWRRGALPLVHAALRLDKPLCAALDGFTLHAATRALLVLPSGQPVEHLDSTPRAGAQFLPTQKKVEYHPREVRSPHATRLPWLARLRCDSCEESRLVAFCCKGRGFCPSCLGRKMCATAANLVEEVLPAAPLRQWVLTVPFAWRKRLGYDGKLLGALTRIFVDTVLRFYTGHGQSGAVVVVQRTSSDLKLNPHVHAVFLDGGYREAQGGEVTFHALAHLSTRDVGGVLERSCKRMRKYLERRGLLARDGNEDDDDANELAPLAASAVSGKTPPAGPGGGGARSPRSRACTSRSPSSGRCRRQ